MQIKRSFITLAFLITLVSSAFAGEVGSKCPVVDVKNNVFDASLLINGSRIEIEKGGGATP